MIGGIDVFIRTLAAVIQNMAQAPEVSAPASVTESRMNGPESRWGFLRVGKSEIAALG
jgi:hypothetical protein